MNQPRLFSRSRILSFVIVGAMVFALSFPILNGFAFTNSQASSLSPAPFGVISPNQCNDHAPAGNSPSSSTGNSISVGSQLLNGTTITGIYFDLRVNNTVVSCGYTPVTFSNLTTGQQYELVAYWANGYYYRHFSNGNLNRYQLYTMNGSSSYSISGVYEAIPANKLATLNVIAQFPNGTQIGVAYQQGQSFFHTPGMFIAITPPGASAPYTGGYTGGSILPFDLVNHETYTIQMANGFGNVFFSHWANSNNTNETRVYTMNGNSTITAIYVQNGTSTATSSTTTTMSTTTNSTTSTTTISSTTTTTSSTTSSSSTTTTSSSSSSSSSSSTTTLNTSSSSSTRSPASSSSSSTTQPQSSSSSPTLSTSSVSFNIPLISLGVVIAAIVLTTATLAIRRVKG